MPHKKIVMVQDKKIALVAHDNKKRDLLEWAIFNRDLLAHHEIYATGTTGETLEQAGTENQEAPERTFGR